MDELSRRIASLSPEQRQLLSLKLQRESTAGLGGPIRRYPQAVNAPLSWGQQRLWFLDQLEPGNTAYNIPIAIRLCGALDSAALEQSLNQIIQRHAILRTRFVAVDGLPVQAIEPALTLTLHNVPLEDLAADEREARVQFHAGAETQQPFDLAQGPLIRGNLLRLAPNEHVLLLTLHHIVFDVWSMGVLLRELMTVYRSLTQRSSQGQPHPEGVRLPALPIQYADYALWQQQWLQGKVFEEQIGYWRQQLGTAPTVLRLPIDRPRPSIQTFNGARREFMLSAALTGALKQLCRRTDATLFMVLLAGLNLLLYRYTDQDDICIGSTIAGRRRSELESLIGFFINTLVMRTDLSGNPTFVELVGRVREMALGAYEHQDLPFERLVEELQPRRDLSYHPLFQVELTLQNLTLPELHDPDLTIQPLWFERGTAKLDLTWIIEEHPAGLAGTVEYNTDLFECATIDRMIGHFQALLENFAAQPDRRVLDVPLLSAAERGQILHDWNNSQVDLPLDRCLHQIFEAQVQRTPQATAVVCESERLSYQMLNRRANRVARGLVERGVGPNSVVALLAERGIDFLVALLAIFKAGGAYLPLDPRYPAQRIAQVIQASGSPLTLTTPDLLPLLSDSLAAIVPALQPQTLTLDALQSEEHAAMDLPPRSTPRDLAYVIYTSGSTGVPKGAMIEQCGMVNHIYAKIIDLQLTERDCVAQTASQCFDISVWQFLAPLLLGGRVHIFGDTLTLDPSQLLQEMARASVTIFETVPSLLRAMLEYDGNDAVDLLALRWLVATGEALPPDLCRQWLSRYPHIPLLNAYGATETSDDALHYAIDRPLALEAVHIPVGRPVANMRVYVLDRQLQPVPVGVQGEIYIGGVGVGRGYLHATRRTAAVFIPDPYAKEPGARLYKTGDLGRYLTDGTIEFLGRIDHQVKLRGFRIELGEIEAALHSSPCVREASVVTHATGSGDVLLVAYIVPSTSSASAADELIPDLRGLLKEQLPEYMVPTAFVVLDALPLTANGKIDRKALPAPGRMWSAPERDCTPPSTPLEEMVAEVWSQVLGIEQIGVYDNFFDLGGTSLSIIRVHALLVKRLNVTIAVVKLFQHPTIQQLAAYLAGMDAEQSAHLERSRSLGARRRERLLNKDSRRSH